MFASIQSFFYLLSLLFASSQSGRTEYARLSAHELTGKIYLCLT